MRDYNSLGYGLGVARNGVHNLVPVSFGRHPDVSRDGDVDRPIEGTQANANIMWVVCKARVQRGATFCAEGFKLARLVLELGYQVLGPFKTPSRSVNLGIRGKRCSVAAATLTAMAIPHVPKGSINGKCEGATQAGSRCHSCPQLTRFFDLYRESMIAGQCSTPAAGLHSARLAREPAA